MKTYILQSNYTVLQDTTIPPSRLAARLMSTSETDDGDTTGIVSSSTPSLLTLPPEVFLHLTTHLPPSSPISLKLSSRALYNVVPSSLGHKDSLDACTALRLRHLVLDMGATNYRCALCKSLYPRALFDKASCLDPEHVWPVQRGPDPYFQVSNTSSTGNNGHASKDNGEGTVKETSMPALRICRWHIPHFVQDLRSVAFKKRFRIRTYDEGPGSWIVSVGEVCMHCRGVRVSKSRERTDAVDIRDGRRETIQCQCRCESCGSRKVRFWWKVETRSCIRAEDVVE